MNIEISCDKKIKITPEELLDAVKKQIIFLKNACKHYDEGEYFYSIELAIKLRVLLYSTKNSSSAYRQLCNTFNIEPPIFMDSREINYLHFANEGQCNFASSYMCQYNLLHYPDSEPIMIPEPKLHRVHYYLFFDEWWQEATVFQWKNIILTRKKVVAMIADQDGGAHIDPQMNGSLAALKREIIPTIKIKIAMGNTYKIYTAKSNLILYAIIRTIANETLIAFEKNIIPLCEEKLKGFNI